MVFYGENEELNTSTISRKIAPGPYRATKLWNGIVRKFREEMQCKKHRRHLKTYNYCFSASEAIDFLHHLLKDNPNIGKDVTRQQTIQLLRKFLKNHIMEDVQGRWGSENFEDDGRLYRFPPGITTAQAMRQPLSLIDGNIAKNFQKKNSKKQKRKSKGPLECENNNILEESPKSNSETEKTPSIKSSSTTSWENLKRPLPPVPAIPKCRVVSQKVTEADVQDVWKKTLLNKLQNTLQLDTLDDIVVDSEISGDDIRHNATRVGKSGVVQVEKEEDLPYWALSAMTCLANWPNSTDTGLPCYPGFEKDVFKAICEYYCGLEPVSLENYSATKRRQSATKRPTQVLQSEPLLTYDHYELFTNIVCLIQPESEEIAVEALRYALLLLPPANKRKLHLLVRLMSKICTNCHLTKLGGHLPTRTMLLQTFSKYILSYNEEVYLDELLAMRLVSFLIDHHTEVMKVPSELEKEVERKLALMRKPEVRYSESCEEIPYMHYVLAANQYGKARLRNKHHMTRADRHKRKSADLMKSWDKLVTSIKSKPSGSSTEKSESSDSDTYIHTRLRSRKSAEDEASCNQGPRRRPRTRTVGNREFLEETSGSNRKSYFKRSNDMEESRIKPAKSCSDICDIKPNAKVTGKSGDMGSSWNLRMFGRPFSKLRKSKV